MEHLAQPLVNLRHALGIRYNSCNDLSMLNQGRNTILLLGIFCTGATALVAQVAWQRYFGHLIGSDHRSSSLVLAIFLTGLTIGYWYFGHIIKKDAVRGRLIKIYAYIEALVGFLFLSFPFLYSALAEASDFLPSNVFFDFILILAGIGIPSFLMGSTLPVLSFAMPKYIDEIQRTHVKIYAFNTLGAFIGASLGGIYLLPLLGLKASLAACGLINLAVAFVFYKISKAEEFLDPAVDAPLVKKKATDSKLNYKILLASVFLVGATIIGLELVVIRILTISLSGLYIVFPVVIGSFILGMGLGSLWLAKHSETSFVKLRRLLSVGIWGLFLIYLTGAYWPYVHHLIREYLYQYSWGWSAYIAVSFLLAALILMPTTFFLGQILPACFIELSKLNFLNSDLNNGSTNTGRTVGLVYALSTIGTLFGAIVLGYLALSFVNLDMLIKLMILSLLVLLFCYYFSEVKKRSRVIIAVVFLHAMFLPSWNYKFLMYADIPGSIFDLKSDWKWGFPPFKENIQMLDYKDGPDMSAGVTHVDRPHPSGQKLGSRTITINGKSDGSTYGDYATNTLMSLLPYLLGPSVPNQRAAVVGLGTGMSVSVLGTFKDIISVDAVEISQTVIDYAEFYESYNYGVLNRPKIKMVHQDAIRFLRGKKDYYDIVVSEPSNLWRSGNENLYTEDYIRVVKRSLKKGGLYSQWMHAYGTSHEVFLSAVKNILDVFEYVTIYSLQPGDFLVLASNVEIPEVANTKRFLEHDLSRVRFRVGWRNPETISLAYQVDQDGLRKVIEGVRPPKHSLNKPTLALMASKAWFYQEDIDGSLPWDGTEKRSWRENKLRETEFVRIAEEFDNYYPECVTYQNYLSSMCVTFMLNKRPYDEYKNADVPLAQRISAYILLRDRGLVPRNETFLNQALKETEAMLSKDSMNKSLMLLQTHIEGELARQ